MSGRLIITLAVLSFLFALIIVSGGVLVWLSVVAEGELNRPQEVLISTADWMIKACAGGILGFAAGLRLANGKTGATSG